MLSSPCPICSSACSVAASSCPACGYSFETKAKQTASTTATVSETRLRPCPDCSHNCSTAALSCPNCGRPFQQTTQRRESNGRSTVKDESFSALENAVDNRTNIGAIAVVCFLLLGAFVLAYFIFWSGSSSQSSTAANDALKALRKVDGAVTQVGVSFPQYNSLLIETQAQVNEALRVMPDGELKREIKAAMEAYNDAGQVWNQKINGRVFLWENDADSRALMQKYNMQPKTSAIGRSADAEVAQQWIWVQARKHLSRASSLAGQ